MWKSYEQTVYKWNGTSWPVTSYKILTSSFLIHSFLFSGWFRYSNADGKIYYWYINNKIYWCIYPLVEGLGKQKIFFKSILISSALTCLPAAVVEEDNHDEAAQTQGERHPDDIWCPHPECSERGRGDRGAEPTPATLPATKAFFCCCWAIYFITDTSIDVARWPVLLPISRYILGSPAVMGVRTDAGESRRSLLLSQLPKHLCLPERRPDKVYSVKPSPSIGHRSVYGRRVGDVDGVSIR